MTEWIANDTEAFPGVGRMRARFEAFAFAPHRHDTYAVGITTHGIQAFDYRGATRGSKKGLAFVLHPDERHDGRAGTDAGFGYSIAYVSPTLIRKALGGTSLPFVRDPVSSDPRLLAAINELLTAGSAFPEMDYVSAISGLALAMRECGGPHACRPLRLDHAALGRAADFLRETRDHRVSMEELERHADLSRWQLARQFRAGFGISMARFNLVRRLERVQEMIRGGDPLSEVACACGFVDQAHMTRSFKQTYGLTPGQWLNLAVRSNG